MSGKIIVFIVSYFSMLLFCEITASGSTVNYIFWTLISCSIFFSIVSWLKDSNGLAYSLLIDGFIFTTSYLTIIYLFHLKSLIPNFDYDSVLLDIVILPVLGLYYLVAIVSEKKVTKRKIAFEKKLVDTWGKEDIKILSDWGGLFAGLVLTPLLAFIPVQFYLGESIIILMLILSLITTMFVVYVKASEITVIDNLNKPEKYNMFRHILGAVSIGVGGFTGTAIILILVGGM